MSAPLVYNSKMMGVINVSERNANFTTTDLKVLGLIAKRSAISIAKTEALHKFEYLSHTDPKTGLFNYRFFIQKLEEEISRAFRYGQGLSLMMVDLDNFKHYNDTYGHLAGDKLLCYVADVFKNNLRKTEYICRYGGDEFGVILPCTNSLQAAGVGDKLRERVAADFKMDRLSLSVGIAEFKPGFNTVSLIRQADQALYDAKKSGRNKVSIFEK
jgi:diguanylate cyclase (GGDEF)-like protein